MAEQTSKTHYRKAFDSPYLSAADIVDPITLTIDRVVLEIDHTKQTKDWFNTCYWREKHIRPGEVLKPMILNATNSKFVAGLTGSKFIEDWGGHSVTVWVDPNVKFGRETVEGLRLSKAVARPETPAALMSEAQKAARAGTGAYAKWFGEITADQRKQLGTDNHKKLKLIAEKIATVTLDPETPPAAADLAPPPQGAHLVGDDRDPNEPPF